MTAQKCIFCSIVAKQIPANVVLETDRIFAFHDISKQAPVHVLVIPKIHLRSVDELAEEHGDLHRELLLGVRDVARKLELVADGYRVVTNTGANAGQSVDHLHFHVLGGRKLGWPPG